ncbi:ATP-grasp domain-containing protein [Leptospira noguchii]|uniref:ATP-grasp domain protein n=1 Tax=Leptospira noguchii serovar Autumnalis str. ZUN142 TaxID=1085540 RepID=M6V0K4_9LEPT|nr:ATP-grasp domain-containing protein [Leptospira noguchii]EMO43063.1 ATP-grasp domain protein [Leptospira noguchii serovar Autumnalis str. ZUN142]EMS88656.1 ATP-grasp domain protein [Leptospira noguchii str. Hook]UOG47556.1 ATP-grasp domain-containing protein [Leptospira noguchii]
MTKKILFTGGGGSGSEGLFKLLEGKYEVHFADADINSKPYSIPLDRWHCIEKASSPNFLDSIKKLCDGCSIDVLIPGVDEELIPLALARENLEFNMLLPPLDFIETHLDKLKSNSKLSSQNLPVPKTDLIDERNSVVFPCIIKPKIGRGSRDVRIIESEEELQAHVLLSRRKSEEFILQEQLIGQEYTVLMVANRQKNLKAIIPVKVGIKKGITIRAMTDFDQSIISACFAIHLNWPVSGCYNIQLIKTDSKEIKPFEINPRVSTTTCLAVAAGVDFISLYLSDENSDNAKLYSFKNNLALKRSWFNEFYMNKEQE